MRTLFRLILLLACGSAGAAPPDAAPAPEARHFALAIHGGAGFISRDMEAERAEEYQGALASALALGRQMLREGASSLDTVEAVVQALEDNPLFNAGKGAVFTHDGKNELDAAIMDGSTLRCGAVAGLTRVKNPVHLARLVMERTKHVLLAGPGAEAFAAEMHVAQVDPSYFFTDRRYRALQRALEKEKDGGGDGEHLGTVGAVALDAEGRLAAATSTGGITNKKHGRVGDVPIIGAGTYANGLVAVSCSGKGEEFIRHNVARDVAALMEYRGLSLAKAAAVLLREKLREGDGGLIAVDREGKLVLDFNSGGMFRGAADSSGRFEVGIWEDMQ